MTNFLISLLALIVTLGILISFHEFGHFWVARRLGVKVLRYSIGFGRPLWLRRGRDGVEYVIAAIPLGGYVKMLDEREGEVVPEERHRAFNRQSVGRRIAIVAAGPLANFLFAILAYGVMFMVGVPGEKPLVGEVQPGSIAAEGGFQTGDLIVAVDGEPTPTLHAALLALVDRTMGGEVIEVRVRDEDDRLHRRYLDVRGREQLAEGGRLLESLGISPWRPPLPAVVAEVQPGGPAAEAGLQPGDRILAVDGQPIQDWEEWAEYVRERPGQTLTVRLDREGREEVLPITPKAVETEDGRVGRIGAMAKVPEEFREAIRVVVHYGPLEAMVQAVDQTWDMSLLTLRVLGRMVIGKASLDNISGPITIARFAGQTAVYGIIPFLSFLALISISLGVINLLPVPVLDGGHLLYYLIELVKGSPLSETAQNLGQRVGIVVLLMLMSLAIFNDFARLLE